ncbi:MAG: tetratricopeptide repeat protein [Candidatus Kariarchaeaceae archaeon]|jgi:tetratricopeptide (TPR) repeat protein
MGLEEIKSLLDKGEYDEALLKIDQSDENKIERQILRSIIFRHKSMFGVALDEIQEALRAARTVNNNIYEMSALIQRTYVYLLLDRPKTLIDQSMSEFEELWKKLNKTEKEKEEIKEIAGNYYHLSAWTFQLYLGDYSKAIQLYDKSFEIRTQLEHSFELVSTLNNLSLTHFWIGEYEKSLTYAKQQLKLCEKLGNKNALPITYGRFANYYFIKGEYDTSREYLNKQQEISKGSGDRYIESSSYHHLGKIDYYEGKYDQALKNYSTSLSLRQDLNIPWFVSESLFGLILTSIKLGSESLVENYMDKLNKLTEISDNKILQINKQLAQALVYKNQPRSKYKLEAQSMLEEIIEGDLSIAFNKILIATLHLCELRLDEFKLYGKEEVLLEIEDMTSTIYELAQERHLYYEMIHILILHAKLAFLLLDLDKANKILQQAHIIADERGLNHLATIIEIEEKKLEDEIGLAVEISKLAGPIHERLEKSKIIDYLVKMQKLVHTRH